MDPTSLITFAVAVTALCLAPLLVVVGTVSIVREREGRTLAVRVVIASGLALAAFPLSMLAAHLELFDAWPDRNSSADELLLFVATDRACELPRRAAAGLALLALVLYALLVYRRASASRQAPADRF